MNHLLTNHLPAHIFLPIITRETPGLMPKPDPAGILHIAQEWGLEDRGDSLIMVSVFLIGLFIHIYIHTRVFVMDMANSIQVGDSIDDMTAGHMAGATTVLLLNERNRHLMEHAHTDVCIEKLDELIAILENGVRVSSAL